LIRGREILEGEDGLKARANEPGPAQATADAIPLPKREETKPPDLTKIEPGLIVGYMQRPSRTKAVLRRGTVSGARCGLRGADSRTVITSKPA